MSFKKNEKFKKNLKATVCLREAQLKSPDSTFSNKSRVVNH